MIEIVMLLLIDNYDSFTYNLHDYFKQLGKKVQIVKNDVLSLAQIRTLKPSSLVISPGPGDPSDAGISLPAIGYFSGKIPILGICLGHQAIAAYFGAKIVPADRPMHGKIASINHDQCGLFTSLPNPMKVVRYHSLMIDKQTLPSCLTISAETNEGTIMAIRHKTLPIEGVQFHPEAILTTNGMQLLNQFFRCYEPFLDAV